MGRGFFLAPAHVFHQLVCDLGQVTTPRAQFPICKMELLPSPWRAAVSIRGDGRCAGCWPSAGAWDVCVDPEGSGADRGAKANWDGGVGWGRTQRWASRNLKGQAPSACWPRDCQGT